MAKIKVRVTVSDIVSLDTEAYVGQWHEKCDEEGDMEEGDEYTDVPEDFAVEQFTTNLEEGNEDLSLVLESGTIEVVKV